jgi:hypothetical protein
VSMDLLNMRVNSSPRSTSEVRNQLAELAVVLRAAEGYGSADFASRMGLDSIYHHQRTLQSELKAADMLESGADVELVLDGDPVADHSVQAGFLGNFLATVQHLVNAIAQAMTSTPTARARLPRNIVVENRLMVTAGFIPSSFGIRCGLPTRESLGQFFELDARSVVESVSELLKDDLPSDELASLVSHGRVKKHYFELLNMLAKNGASVRIRTRQNPYGSELHTKQARERVEWLELLLADEERINYSGVLIGGNIETGRFELKVGDDTISGKASDEAKNQLREITFGAYVEAEVRVTTMSHEEGAFEPKISHMLVSVKTVRQDFVSP